jgi:predicted DNA-binding ribbon-helix-helix protein
MKSLVVKRSVALNGHKTSISLEEPFWKGLKEIARGKQRSIPQMISLIDAERAFANLSSAVRLFVLNHYRGSLAGEGAVQPDKTKSMPATRTTPH